MDWRALEIIFRLAQIAIYALVGLAIIVFVVTPLLVWWAYNHVTVTISLLIFG